MKAWLALWAAGSAVWGAEPRIVYSREQPGSQPAYVWIALERDGQGVYRESPEEEGGTAFRLLPHEVDAIFDLAKRLDYFRKPLDANVKVGNVGLKTFRYEAGGQVQEVQFHYSRIPEARLLADWFARITETQQALARLQRCLDFDKLGAHQVLLQIQILAERERLVGAPQLLPLLDRIAEDETYLNIARKRARLIAERIRQSSASPPAGSR